MKRKTEIILALDVDNLKKARYFLDKLYPRVKVFKIGPQLFTACGPKAIEMVRQKGAEVFLDLKFFDIPNTTAQAVRMALRQRVKMLTLHILGGQEMLKAAVEAGKEEAAKAHTQRPLLIGVTVLTSKEAKREEVLALAKKGLGCGLDGIVCSVKEAAFLRKRIKNKRFLIVTPGIRPRVCAKDDQKRHATARDAVKAGSDFLVVGRPILEAAHPLDALRGFR
ncbi:MAG: orotidine-5'-phosphate decarboxylase [Candidatus Omnitrophota bacterium]